MTGSPIADGDEVLRFITAVMRGTDADATFKERFRAAELLGKRYELFADGAETAAAGVTIVDDLRENEP